MNAPLLKVRNLSKRFTNRASAVCALDDVSFEIYPGECLGIIGESGSGKSTLARILMHLLTPSSGSIFFEGQDLLNLSKKEIRKLSKKRQMVFQDPYSSLNPRMTVSQILSEPLDIEDELSPYQKKRRIHELLGLVHLSRSVLNRYSHEFSGGQRQRIGIARALATSPSFLICDEPVSALDVSVGAQIVNLLKELKEELGLTYLFIGHDLNIVRYLSDRALVLYQGKAVEVSQIETLFTDPQDLYTKRLLNAAPSCNPTSQKEKYRRLAKSSLL